MSVEQFATMPREEAVHYELVQGELIRVAGARSFVHRQRTLALVDPDKIPLPFPPDIAVEVLSATESAIELSRKIHEYLGAGAQEVWANDSVNGEIMVRTVAEVRVLGGEGWLSS